MSQRKPSPKFTAAERDLIIGNGRAVWNEIAYDIEQMCRDNGEKRLPATHIIELVCDAGRLEDQMRRTKCDPDLIARVGQLDIKACERLFKGVFHAEFF